MSKKDTYDAIAGNGDNSADVGITFEASSPEDARKQADELLEENGVDDRTAAVIDERTGKETDF